MSLRDEINLYYSARDLEPPNDLEALLWLLSEVGELAEAYLEQHPFLKSVENNVIGSLRQQIAVGAEAESAVLTLRNSWKRNGERNVTRADLASECADCMMMLDRFTKAHGMMEPAELLRAKMLRKVQKLKPVDSDPVHRS